MPVLSLTAEQFEELQNRLRLYHEAASYYVPAYAGEVEAAWADVIDLAGELTEAARVAAPVRADQLSLFAVDGGWL